MNEKIISVCIVPTVNGGSEASFRSDFSATIDE